MKWTKEIDRFSWRSACRSEGMENMKAFGKERNIQFPYILDDTQEVAKAYGAACTPDFFLFDKEQKEHTIDENIQKLLKGEVIGDEFKPSMGCSIKWIE